jgi:hypothetical protein
MRLSPQCLAAKVAQRGGAVNLGIWQASGEGTWQQDNPAHAELVEARTTFGRCLDKLGMSGVGFAARFRAGAAPLSPWPS